MKHFELIEAMNISTTNSKIAAKLFKNFKR